ncbi:unnamed protein product [Phytophthora fragariaefolia]|uniref:Unnamed protein product n=1 Tax=Phytophthora fragariaefolia TaxID=1490495 RepID=A0A9W7CMQ2_9STRA|nr:unnamed protein product [Phytophthora fragariaefolia]
MLSHTMKARVHAATSATRASAKPSQSPHKWSACVIPQAWHKAIGAWNRCQIGHRSHYSIERVLALQEYIQHTSFLRAFAVCFLAPIPATAVALVIDCIPLRPPSDGWQANYMLWVRLFLSMFVVSIGLVLQVNGAAAKNIITNAAALRICLCSSFLYVAMSIAVAAVLKFPIPFGYVLMVGPYITIFSIVCAFSIGFQELEKPPILRKQLFTLGLIIFAQGIVAVAYPIFNAVFIRLSGISQTAFVFVMPLIKFTTKQIISRSAESLHEYVGPIVVFSVDVFNVFYVSICMQTATSTTTALIFIASDSFHVVLALRDIFQRQTASQVGSHDSRVVESHPQTT